MSARDASALLLRVQELQRPSIRNASDPSFREHCEQRAIPPFAEGLEASRLSQRAYARRIGVDERIVRDWLSGARNVPVYAIKALPRAGQLAFLEAMLREVPPESSPEASP